MFFCLSIIAFILKVNGQRIKDLARYEKRWAAVHPFAAFKIKRMYQIYYPVYQSVKKQCLLDSFKNGGKLDAFRHAFFMAAFAQKIKPNKLKKLGLAHEKGNYSHFLKNKKDQGEIPDSISSIMDLHNNKLGIIIGKNNKHLPENDLKELVISELNNGKGLYVKRNKNGQYVNCNDEVIIIGPEKKWAIPKCLIKTNE